MDLTYAVPVVQSLLSTVLWEAGRTFARASEPQEAFEALGRFSAQTLAADAVATVAADELRQSAFDAVTDAAFEAIFEDDEVSVLTHELLVVRLLEQPEPEAERVSTSLIAVVKRILGPDVDGGVIAIAVYDMIDSCCQTITQHLDLEDVPTRASIQQLAGLSSLVSTAKSIDRHLKILSSELESDSTSKYADFQAAYRNQLHTRHGSIVLPDFEIERRLPIDNIYVEPTLMGPDGQLDGWRDLVWSSGHSVVLGSPGGGKSTLAQVVTYRCSTTTVVPFLVILRDYGSDFNAGMSIVEHIESVLNTRYQSKPPVGWVERVLISGSSLVIFDGLDELLEPAKRRAVKDAVEAFSDAYPYGKVLVTSRLVGYDQAPLNAQHYTRVRLGELTEDGVEQYVQGWFDNATIGLSPAERSARISGFMRESESVSDLRSNPLMLSLMCVLYRGSNYIPESRLNLYEECAKLLFKKWDRQRGINVRLEIGPDIDAALMHFAYWLLSEDRAEEGVLESTLVDRCVEYLVPRRFEDEDQGRRVAEEFVSFCRDRAWILVEAGSTSTGDALYTFTHRTFLEFYAASQLARTCGTPEGMASELCPRLAASQWDVVAQLALQIAHKNHDRGADRFLGTLLDDADAPTRVLDFCARSLQFLIPSPETIRRISRLAVRRFVDATDAIISQPHSPDTDRRDVDDEEDDGDDDLDVHMEVPLDALPLAHVLGVMPVNRTYVADELRATVTPAVAKFGSPVLSIEDKRLLLLAFFARSAADVPDVWLSDSFVFWSGWSASLPLPSGPLDPNIISRYPYEIVSGAFEIGLIDLEMYLQMFEIQDLWRAPYNRDLGINRIAVGSLLQSWLRGHLYDAVFLPGAVGRIFAEISDAFTRRLFSLPAALPNGEPPFRNLEVDAERSASLSGTEIDGAVLILCASEEWNQRRPLRTEQVEEKRAKPVRSSLSMVVVEASSKRYSPHPEAGWSAASARVVASLSSETREFLNGWASGSLNFWLERVQGP